MLRLVQIQKQQKAVLLFFRAVSLSSPFRLLRKLTTNKIRAGAAATTTVTITITTTTPTRRMDDGIILSTFTVRRFVYTDHAQEQKRD